MQIIVDPYFRTLRGFEVLVEKDWVHYGHQFRLRSGFCSKDEKDQRAPIFLQFLDCVHQLIQQFPFAFEFNTKLLSDLYYYSQTSLFGTFLCNSSSVDILFDVKGSNFIYECRSWRSIAHIRRQSASGASWSHEGRSI